MATTVGSHAVSAFATPVNGGPLDANVVRGNDNTIRTAYVAHDADTGIHVQSSTLASRPAAGTAGRKWITADTGSYKLWYDDGTTWHEVAAGNIDVFVIAGEALAKGDVVKATGYNNGTGAPIVAKVASASDTAFGIVNSTSIANGATGYITNTGLILDVATNAFAIGDILYPNTSGGLTATKPTSGNYQPVAFVLRSNLNNGVLYVEFSAPRIVERSDNTASTIVLRDASGDFAAGTITATAVNTTTIDLTNLEVTNIKAKDGTASATIADSTGVMTIGSSVLTTTDINGGTIDGTVIGGASAAAGTFTTATATTGNITTVNATTVDTTNIEVTNVKAKDGTASIAIADSTGVATISAAPILSALTASQAVFTNASKALVSNAITGTGNVVMSASPTLTGTVTADTVNATTLGGTLSTAAQANITSVGTLSSLTVSGDLTVDTNTMKVSSAADAVLFGTTTSLAVGGGTRKIQVQDTTGTVGISVVRNTTTVISGGSLALGRSRGTVVNDVTAVQAGDFLGLVQFAGADGTDLASLGARIAAVADGTISTGVVPGYLRFDTADATGNLNEVVRVTSDRRLEIRASNNGITDGSSVNVLRFVDTDTSTANGQGVGAIEFYTSDTTAPGARVVAAIRSVAPGASGGASLAFDVAANAGTKFQAAELYTTAASDALFNLMVPNTTANSAVYFSDSANTGRGKVVYNHTTDAMSFETLSLERVRIPSTGGAVVGTAALATTATDGFLYVPTCAGTPTGTPTTQTGTAPIVVDTTNHKLYFYSGGSWRDAGP